MHTSEVHISGAHATCACAVCWCRVGYVMDYPYREQSAPWFGVNKVARGGCYATPDLVVRGTYRSFYHPTDRKELAVGFRTCQL